MIIGISGTTCSGKNEVANYLVLNGFTLLQVKPPVPTLRVPSIPGGVPGYDFDQFYDDGYDEATFDSKYDADNADKVVDPLQPATDQQNHSNKNKNTENKDDDEIDSNEKRQKPVETKHKNDNNRKKTIKELMDEYSEEEDIEDSKDEPLEIPKTRLGNSEFEEIQKEEDSDENQKESSFVDNELNKKPMSRKIVDKSSGKGTDQGSPIKPSKSITDLIHEMTMDEVHGQDKSSYNMPANYQTPYLPTTTAFTANPGFDFGHHISFAANTIGATHQPHQQLNLPYTEYVSKEGLRRMVFDFLPDLTKYVGTQWRSDFVIILNSSDHEVRNTLAELSKMPYFLHIAVDASITVRWKRYLRKIHDYEGNSVRRLNMDMIASVLNAKLGKDEPKKNQNDEQIPKENTSKKDRRDKILEAALKPSLTPPVSLEDFVELYDQPKYGPQSLAAIYSSSEAFEGNQPRITIVNNDTGLGKLYVKLGRLNLRDTERLRPSWDLYFMRLAGLAALRSNCMKRRVGCVVVRENRVIATGYNGTPRGLTNCNEGGCVRCNGGGVSGANLDSCVCLHAEENALLEAGRDRVGASAVLYCSTAPCLTCSIKIVQCGIKEVVYQQKYSAGHNSEKLFIDAGIKVRQYVPPDEGIVM